MSSSASPRAELETAHEQIDAALQRRSSVPAAAADEPNALPNPDRTGVKQHQSAPAQVRVHAREIGERRPFASDRHRAKKVRVLAFRADVGTNPLTVKEMVDL